MKVSGPLTNARLAAEAARIARIASKMAAHQTLRMHEGTREARENANPYEARAFCDEIEEILKAVRG